MKRRLVSLALLCGAAAAMWAQFDTSPLSDLTPAPGIYSADRVVSAAAADMEYRFVTPAGTPHTDFFMPFDNGLLLRVPDDAEARFSLEVRRRNRPESTQLVAYTIDKMAPSAVHIEPAQGLYTAPVDVAPARDEGTDRFFYYIANGRGSTDASFAPVPENGVRLEGDAGAVVDYRLALYAVDGAGNRGPVRTVRYRIDRRGERPRPASVIVSPVPGVFANRQLLYLDTTGIDDVSVRVLGPDGRDDHFPYREERLIDGTGRYTVRITARDRATDSLVSEEVTWEQTVLSEPPAVSGRVTETIRIDNPEGVQRYTLEDRAPTGADALFLRPLALPIQADTLRTVALRHTNSGGIGESRYLFLLDGRRPPPPEFIIDSERVIAFSLTDTVIEWRPIAQGGVEHGEWRVWDAPVTLTGLPEGTTALRARARFAGSGWSAVSTVSVTRPDFRPLPDPIAAAAQGSVEFTFADDGASASDSEPYETLHLMVVSEDIELDGERSTFVDEPSSVIFRAAVRSSVRWYLPHGYLDRLVPTVHANRGTETVRRGEAIEVDAAPPAPPTIVVDDARVVLDGGGERYYRINGGALTRYREAIVLGARDGVALQYRLEAYQTAAGRVSPTVEQTITVDRRELFLPSLETDIPVTPFNDERVVLRFANPHADLLIHYEISTSGSATIPRDESPSTSDAIVLTTPAGEAREYAIAARARFRSGTRWSVLRRFTVRVDRVPPEPPVLERSTVPEIATGPVLIAFEEPSDPLTAIWFRADSSAEYRRYISPVSFDLSGSGLDAIVIEAYSEDRAGNRRFMENPVRIAVHTERPDPPALMMNGRPVTTRRIDSAREALISPAAPPTVDATGGAPVIWWRIYSPEETLRSTAITPGNAAPDFERFEGADRILEVASDGREELYVVETFLEDSAGRRSAVRRLDVVMDSRPPLPPEAPFVVRAPDGRSGTVTWPGTGTATLFVSTAGTTSPEYFAPVDGALSWELAEGRETITFNYFSVDDAGNRSELRSLTIAASDRLAAPRFVGAEDGGVYREGQVLTMESATAVRYTLSTDGNEAPIVHPLSARYESPLVLDAAAGEEVTYHIRARTVDSDGVLHGERHIRFTVDRRPPSLPDIAGIDDSAYYPGPREARLVAGDGDSVMYRVRLEDREGVEAAHDATTFTEYRGERIELSAPPGSFARYTIEAYSIDRAGNRSQEIRRWSTVIDRSIVYVARDGRPGAEGTRDDPLDDLNAALEMIVTGRRQTILLGGGRYRLTPRALARTVREGGHDITLIGGAEDGTWAPGGGPTIIATDNGEAIVLVPGVSLHDLIVDATVTSEIDAAPNEDTSPAAGEVRLLRATIGTPRTEREFRHNAGRIVVRESLIAGGGGLIIASDATAMVEDSDVDRIDVSGGVLSVSGGRLGTIVASTDASISLSDVSLDGHGASPLHGSIRLTASTLVVEDSVVSAGITGEMHTPHAVAIRATESQITLDRSALFIGGTESALGMRMRGGNVSIRDSIVVSDSGGAGYGIVAREGARIALEGSVVAVRSTADALALVGSGSSFVADHSVFHVDDAGVVSGKVADLDGRAGSLILRDVLFSRPGLHGGDTASLSIGPDSELSITRAAVDGWSAIVETSSSDSWRDANRFSLPRLNASPMGEENRIVRYDGSPVYDVPNREDIPAVLRQFGGSWWNR